jgi:hypothetical protein
MATQTRQWLVLARVATCVLVTPIGELRELETLSSMCIRKGRYSFMLASALLHVRGGVTLGSLSGTIVIF